jgi:MoaA/NifB/PqqE/SkfB family radical SAM enzyme
MFNNYCIELTNICNLKCPNCIRAAILRPPKIMSLVELNKILSCIVSNDPAARNKRVALHGYGELFGLSNFNEYLDTFNNYGFTNCDFSTNGTLITEEKVKKIANKRALSWIKVSLNSSRKDVHEKYNLGSNYDITLNNLKNLIKWKSEVGSHIRVVAQLLKGNLNSDETVAEFQKTINYNVEILEAPMNSYNQQIPNAPYSNRDSGECVQYATHWLMISSNGEATGCCGDGGFIMSCGNFNSDNFNFQNLLNTVNDFKRTPPILCQRCIDR